jgi:hypothetical protein
VAKVGKDDLKVMIPGGHRGVNDSVGRLIHGSGAGQPRHARRPGCGAAEPMTDTNPAILNSIRNRAIPNSIRSPQSSNPQCRRQ